MSEARAAVIGGLGWPYDALAAAALARAGLHAEVLGALDADALERGRAALPPGQCAPMLYLTGAILRRASETDAPFALFALQSCGPCRYALFAPAWRHLLDERGRSDVWIARVAQRPHELAQWLSGAGAGLLATLVTADALSEVARRVAPYAHDPDEVDRGAREVARRVATRIERGDDPIRALAAERGWHGSIALAPSRPLARAVIVGEPWSLHVEGDGQLHLPSVLARAGVEVELPPASLWLAYVLSQVEGPRFGNERVDHAARRTARALTARLRELFVAATDAAGLEGFELDDPSTLAELAAPFLPSSIRGGYGSVELGLAARARRDRRAHLVISVKSFGCVPSGGVSDGILPVVLGDQMPFLSLEVCGDGEAARESRVALRVAAALDAAETEFLEACARRGLDPQTALAVAPDPLRARTGPHACTLACIAETMLV